MGGMIVGGYSLDLYCDDANHAFTLERFQFAGTTKKFCLGEARKNGWVLDEKQNRAICPVCAAKRKAVKHG